MVTACLSQSGLPLNPRQHRATNLAQLHSPQKNCYWHRKIPTELHQISTIITVTIMSEHSNGGIPPAA